MTRPALIIGLGGTGQWVLTYLKKDLMESNNGRMPDTVRLLCFDTMPQAGAEVVAAAAGRRGEGEVKVGSVQLEKDTEFVHLGGDVYELSEIVCEDTKRPEGEPRKLPHIASWFQACHWLANLPKASFVLSAGAGQLRQFGRIALFRNLRSVVQSEVWRALDVAIGQLAPELAGEQRLEIIIVGSFAGGTGSGIFIDMAFLARHRARNVPNLIRGYFVLPRAFDPDADDDMLARSFAAWRELNRMMVVNQDFALPRLVYNTVDTEVQIAQVRTKVFDACYLVDGVRGGARVAAESELGVFPTVADAISAILDDTAGRAYTEWVVQNLAPVYARQPGIPLYSVVGTHTFKVPVYYAQQDFVHRFTEAWLERFLKPVREEGQVVRLDCASPYDPVKVGREEALSLLTSPQQYQYQAGTEIKTEAEVPTLFFSRVADIIAEGGASNRDRVDQFARGSWGGQAWLESFSNLGDRQDMMAMIGRVRQAARLRVLDVIKPSRLIKEPAREFPRRAEKNLEPFVRENYGFRSAALEENRGKFGDILDECSQAQVHIFRRLVRLWLLRSLNGGDKCGRLGYAHDLMDGLVGHFNDFLDFMDRVKDLREDLKPYLRVQEDRERKKKTAYHYSTKPFLFFFVHPKAYPTQVAYLKSEQAVIDARKDELLHRSVVETVRAMQQYCVEVREELWRWIRMLATGDPATGVRGIFNALEHQRRDIEKTRQADARLTAVQTLLGDLKYPEDREEEELGRLLAGIKWEVEGGEHFRLRLGIAPTGEAAVELKLPTGQERAERREEVTQWNLRALQDFAYRRFSQLPEETRVAERLAAEYDPAGFAGAVGGRAEPLFDRAEGVEGGPAKWSELIRVSKVDIGPETSAFLEGATDSKGNLVRFGVLQQRRQLKNLAPTTRDQDKLVEVVGSSDAHKCTVVRTDDLLPVELFRAWGDCQAAYLRNKRMPPHLNHIFPAEANAARYELKLAQKRRKIYRVFHPWVVMLLEHPERLEQFFLCWALEWIKVKQEAANSYYELNVPGFGLPFWLTPPSTTLWSIFQAARFFVLEGRDQHSGSAWMLDYKKVNAALEGMEKQMGDDAWLAFLRRQYVGLEEEKVDAASIYAGLRRHIEELNSRKELEREWPAGEPANYQQAYADLADVAALMFEERLERKEMQLGR